MRAQDYYQDGSAARSIYTATPVPEEFFEEEKKTTKERQQVLKRAERRVLARSKARAAKKKKLLRIWICIGVAAVVGISILHLASRGEVAKRTNEINRLRQELTEITEKNDAFEAEINNSIDYDAIRDTALNDYGMIYPADGQIITYDNGEEGYIKQYKDL